MKQRNILISFYIHLLEGCIGEPTCDEEHTTMDYSEVSAFGFSAEEIISGLNTQKTTFLFEWYAGSGYKAGITSSIMTVSLSKLDEFPIQFIQEQPGIDPNMVCDDRLLRIPISMHIKQSDLFVTGDGPTGYFNLREGGFEYGYQIDASALISLLPEISETVLDEGENRDLRLRLRSIDASEPNSAYVSIGTSSYLFRGVWSLQLN